MVRNLRKGRANEKIIFVLVVYDKQNTLSKMASFEVRKLKKRINRKRTMAVVQEDDEGLSLN